MDKILQTAQGASYGLAFLLTFWPFARKVSKIVALIGVALGLAYILGRYHRSWPMTPMYLGSVAVPPFLALFGLISFRPEDDPAKVKGLSLTFLLALITALLSIIFPKDFYLPFLKTASIFSQAHLVFNFLGKAAFLMAGIWAIVTLGQKREEAQIRLWLAIGFVFWTLSMLTGEVWSYLGWGLPVVWDEAVIVCFMATWFFYSAILHLFLIGRWPKARRGLTILGIFWIYLVSVTPDLGPARFPPALW
ncbi:MAG: cytochrome c biogenesis protein [Deltaproteobacteria bacterium]|jgi:hypothetical protein|nr:cytochrome c biogenesis protein [Deltaproteobacteria bacterium]